MRGSERAAGVGLLIVLAAAGCGGSGSGGGASSAAGVTSGTVGVTASAISPAVGASAQATAVTISGQGLLQVRGAALIPDAGGAGTALVAWQVSSDARASASAPAGMAVGAYRLELTTPAGVVATAVRFQVQASATAPPTVTSLSPSEGPNDRSHLVTLQGTGFAGGAAVSVGGLAASAVVVRSATRLEATFPADLPPGAQQVVVTQGSAASAPATWTALNALDPDQPGAFQVGTLDVKVPGASGDRPDARIYYPAVTAGPGASPDTRAGPCPVVVYSHGFRPPLISFGIGYLNNTFLAAHLAAFGYVVLSIDQSPNNDLFDTGQNNAQRDADDARAALDYLQAANADPSHPLLGFLDPTRAAFAGHSRGGDASLIGGGDEVAANGTARLKALVALGPPSVDAQNNNAPLAFGAFGAAPTLLIGASDDAVAPFANQQDILALASPPAMAIEIDGGNHSFYKDNDTGILGDGSATISLAVQQAICQRYVTAWLNAHLKGRRAAMAPFVGQGAQVQGDARLRTVSTR